MTRTRNYIRAAAVIGIAMALAACVDGDGTGALVRPIGPPPGPTVTVTARTDGLAVSWTSVAGATSYNVLRGANGGAITALDTVTGATSYVDTVVDGSRYCYEVVGVLDGGSTTLPSAQACATAPGGTACGTTVSSFAMSIPSCAFAQTPGGWLAVYDGPDGGLSSLHARVSCHAAISTVELCAWQVNDDRSTNPPQACSFATCAAGTTVDLVTPMSFVSGPNSTVTVFVGSTLNATTDYGVASAGLTVQPGVTL